MKTNFYVDAFNLYYGSLKGTPDRWLDLDALFRAVFPKNQVNRIRARGGRGRARRDLRGKTRAGDLSSLRR
jgi:hypothetical protein